MTDFKQNSIVKSAIRRLTNPIADTDAFNAIVQSVITTNPFGCVPYMSSGASHPPVEKTRESYTARFVYVDGNKKQVGSGTGSYNTITGFDAGIIAKMGNAGVNKAHGGTVLHDTGSDTYSATLKCHDAKGEMYFVHFSRQQVSVSSYTDDSIRNRVETWADGVPVLN
jgi:hypothetical protein